MKILALAVGGAMFSFVAFAQQAPYDLGDVGGTSAEIGTTAATWTGHAVDAVSKGIPLSEGLVWFAAAITFLKVVLDSTPVKTLSTDRAANAEAKREEQAKAADHKRQLELMSERRKADLQ